MDDVLNVAGHRIGTMEVESALVDHPSVAEAAVVGTAHEIKGQAITAFVTIKESASSRVVLCESFDQRILLAAGEAASPPERSRHYSERVFLRGGAPASATDVTDGACCNSRVRRRASRAVLDVRPSLTYGIWSIANGAEHGAD